MRWASRRDLWRSRSVWRSSSTKPDGTFIPSSLPSQGDVQIDDRVAAVALGVDRLDARGEELALELEHLEEAHGAVAIAQLRELVGAPERDFARLAREEGLALVGLGGDRVAHLAERVGDGLLVGERRFARARVGEVDAAADLAAREERLQQPARDAPGARRAQEEIAQLLALAAVV